MIWSYILRHKVENLLFILVSNEENGLVRFKRSKCRVDTANTLSFWATEIFYYCAQQTRIILNKPAECRKFNSLPNISLISLIKIKCEFWCIRHPTETAIDGKIPKSSHRYKLCGQWPQVGWFRHLEFMMPLRFFMISRFKEVTSSAPRKIYFKTIIIPWSQCPLIQQQIEQIWKNSSKESKKIKIPFISTFPNTHITLSQPSKHSLHIRCAFLKLIYINRHIFDG